MSAENRVGAVECLGGRCVSWQGDCTLKSHLKQGCSFKGCFKGPFQPKPFFDWGWPSLFVSYGGSFECEPSQGIGLQKGCGELSSALP